MMLVEKLLEAIDTAWKLAADDSDLALLLCESSAGLPDEQSAALVCGKAPGGVK